MKNYSKILCVVLALIMALSATSCSLSPEYAYQQDDIELPVGVYIYYMYSAYNTAQGYAQKSELYNAETGKYDGKDSFLKIEITDDDGETAVAEDWILDKAKKDLQKAIAINDKFNELGCTLDEAASDEYKAQLKSQWDTTSQNQQSYKEMFEPYGIGFESIFQIAYTIPAMEAEVFKTEYGVDGPSAVSDENFDAFFKENYTSFKYFYTNLYTTATADETDGSEETSTSIVPLSEDEIASRMAAFSEYASTLSDGGSYDDVIASYMKDNDIEQDPSTTGVEIIGDDETDEIRKTIKEMKDGQAMTLEIGEEETGKQLYLIYREPIENQLSAYRDDENNKLTVLHEMKDEDFEKLIDELIESKEYELSSACKSYKPSMFEEKK